MLQIAICDDNKEDLEKIHQAAIAYFGETNPNVKYYLYNTSFDLLDDIEKHNVFDILLLDICMPGMLGTDVAAELRKEKLTSEIVFLTTSDEFAIEAFAVNRRADEPLGVFRHEIDVSRRYRGCGDNEVTFIFTVFVIDDDNHTAVADILNGLLNRCKI